ncbi:MAG: transposase [Gaiellaceae bacterium]
MGRCPRRELPGGLAHVTCRTIRRLPLFRTEADARASLDLLDHVTRDVADWRVLAYCLMPNHLHFVVDATVEQLSLAMYRFNGLYAQRFNRTHGYRGHLFQGRFHAKPIVDEAHLPGSIRYVLLNPVRAGLCSRPEHWRWSSYRACAGLEPARAFLDLERVLSCFGADKAAARASFCSFVEDGIATARAGGQSPGLSPRSARDRAQLAETVGARKALGEDPHE